MRNPFFHLTKFFACAVILLLTCCVYMHQAQGLCSTLTIVLEPQGRYKHCLMQIDVRGSGTLFDGKTHHRNSSERYVLYQGRRKAFRLYTAYTVFIANPPERQGYNRYRSKRNHCNQRRT